MLALSLLVYLSVAGSVCGQCQQQGVLTNPTPGSTLSGSLATFSWSAGSGATAYWLYLGTTGIRSSNLYSSGLTTGTSVAVSGLPTNGVTIYATLYTETNGSWQPASYTYTEFGNYTLATMNGAGGTLTGSSATFTWNPGAGPTAYWLYLGTNGPGTANLYSSGSTTGTSLTVNGLPTNGGTIYATLFSEIDGAWQPKNYTYTASGTLTLAALTNGSTLGGSSVTFQWTAGSSAVTAYWLYLGTTGPHSANLYNSGLMTSTSVSVTGLPTYGETIYATLFSLVDAAWLPASYTFTEAGDYSLATMSLPVQGATLPGSTASFTWNPGTGATAYWLYLGSNGVQSANLYNSGLLTGDSVTVNGLPTNGETIYATLFSQIGTAWKPENYTYTAAPANQQFLALSTSGTYLVNPSTGNPVFLVGDDGWSVATQLDNADADTYLSTRASQGYNIIWLAAADNVYQNDAPDNYYGFAPFSGSDFTNEGSQYWSHIDSIVQEAESYGIIVAIDPAFVGLSSADGYLNSYNNSSCSTLTAYGAFLGNRYKGYPNIVWATGGDASPGLVSYSKLNCLDQGIVGADPNHLLTMEACPQATCGFGSTSTSEDWTKANVGTTPVPMNLNWVYNQYQSIQSSCAANYAAAQTAGPSLVGETWYENDRGLNALQIREEGYWGVLSGCTTGYIFGNDPVWCFNATSSAAGCDNSVTWQSQLTSNGSVTQEWMGKLMRSREFWKMVPDSANAVLTGGIGSGTSISVAGCTSDGETCIIYDPLGSAQAPHIAMSRFSGTVQAWWFNPQTGATTNAGTFANSGTQTFTPANGNDWVLVLDLQSAGLPAPGVGSLQ